ncbi:MAG TPA: hypothetical protein VKQ05_10770 [Gemmatimonadales bacterium]|nr:hypothetical protein [Gemmatimonadales bacterium]
MRAVSLALVTAVVALPAVARAQQPPAPPAAAAKPASAADTGSTQAQTLLREVFAYEGGGRDPFMSLLKSGDVRPLISDLKLTTVVYDGRFASRSVAVLRDITNRHIYRVKAGDIIGRLKVTQIRPREVVFTVQEFGFERQETLSLAKQEETP